MASRLTIDLSQVTDGLAHTGGHTLELVLALGELRHGLATKDIDISLLLWSDHSLVFQFTGITCSIDLLQAIDGPNGVPERTWSFS